MRIESMTPAPNGVVVCAPSTLQWVKSSGGGSAMSRCLRLQGYTTDPASLPVQYRAELAVEGASGTLGPDSLRVTLFGARGETAPLHLDASRAAAGRTLACAFEAANVGQLERLRIGLAPADGGTGTFVGSQNVLQVNNCRRRWGWQALCETLPE